MPRNLPSPCDLSGRRRPRDRTLYLATPATPGPVEQRHRRAERDAMLARHGTKPQGRPLRRRRVPLSRWLALLVVLALIAAPAIVLAWPWVAPLLVRDVAPVAAAARVTT